MSLRGLESITFLLGAVIWGDDTAVSNACRCAKPGTVDDVICNDKALQKAQETCLDIAKKAAWKAVELFFGTKFSKP